MKPRETVFSRYSAPHNDCVPGRLHAQGLFARLPIACKNKTAASEAERIISSSNRARRNGLFLPVGRRSLPRGNQAGSIWIYTPPPLMYYSASKSAAALNECIYLITDNKMGLDEVAASSDTVFRVARLPVI